MNGKTLRTLGFLPLIAMLAGPLPAIADFQGFKTDTPLFGETSVGNTSIVVRTVTGTMENDTRHLQYRDDVYHNELITTEEESATEITFLDDTAINLGPNSSIVLDQFVYDPDPTASSFVVTFSEGAMRFTSGVLPSEAYKINTPVATIGIRGTIIDVVVDRKARSDGSLYTSVNLSVVEGEADLVNCAGDVTQVAAGLSSTVTGSSEGCSEGSE
jgi:hypothetical protein